MNKFNKKSFLFSSLLALATVVVLTGCSGGGDDSGANSINLVPESQAPKPIAADGAGGGGGGVSKPADQPETGP